MKTFLSTAMLLALCSACDPTITFDVPVDGEATIEGQGIIGDLLGQFDFNDLNDMDFNQTSAFQNNDTRKNQVRACFLQSFVLEVTAPEGGDFRFLESLAFSVESDGLDAVEVASIDWDRQEEGRIEMNVPVANIGAFVRADEFSVTADAVGSPPSDDTTISASAVFIVEAGL